MFSRLDKLRKLTTVVADTGDIEAINIPLKMPQLTPHLS